MYWLSSNGLLEGDSKDDSVDSGKSDCAPLAVYWRLEAVEGFEK